MDIPEGSAPKICAECSRGIKAKQRSTQKEMPSPSQISNRDAVARLRSVTHLVVSDVFLFTALSMIASGILLGICGAIFLPIGHLLVGIPVLGGFVTLLMAVFYKLIANFFVGRLKDSTE